MTSAELLSAVGAIVTEHGVYDSRVVAGHYGNAVFTARGYVVGDPCYLLGNSGTRLADEYYAAVRDTFPYATYDHPTHRRQWRAWIWRGRTCYERDTGGDGSSHFGLCVDSGCLAAIPWSLVLPEVRSVFADRISERHQRLLIAGAAQAAEWITEDELETYAQQRNRNP